MTFKKKSSTTRLPQPLRDELAESLDNHHSIKKRQVQASRKDIRRQERAARKQNKAEFFSIRRKRPFEEDNEEPRQQKKAKYEIPVIPGNSSLDTPRSLKQGAILSKSLPKSLVKSSKSTIKVFPSDKPTRSSNIDRLPTTKTQRERDDDSYIAYLESKLGYTKGNKRNKLEDDGLGDLLDFVSSTTEQIQQDYPTEGSNFSGSEETPEDEAFEEWSGIDEQLASNDDGDEEMDDPGDGESKSEGDHSTISNEQSEVGVRYIPPHIRLAQQESQENVKLSRQLKGLLNRISEQNMGGILDSIEEIYRNHKRNDVTSTLTKLILDGIASHASLLDSYVVMYAAFVASLYRIIGTEFAAYFVQNGVSTYEHYYAILPADDLGAGLDSEGIGKECANLIVLFSELYNFQVISSILVFDLIRELLVGDLTEFGVELLLKIVRNSGQQLRQDDPSALKDIIEIVQNKVDVNKNLSSRTRFMIETLINLKNNKLKRNTTQNQGGEAVERMKKFLAGLAKKRHLFAHEPLRVSLEDLRSAETKGKWWLVGAAWGGDPLTDRQEHTEVRQATEETNDSSLLRLARVQGMNTDIRRSIFIILMSSDDYVDACERLSQLTLNEVQQREIVRVILHCCGNEKSYNPYYTLVCQHLCRTSHSHKITLQFCLWDFFRDLGETAVGGTQVIKIRQDEDGSPDIGKISDTRLRNVARAYAWWIAKDCVALTILKPVDFTDLKPQSREFLREMFVQIFISSQVTSPVFSSNSKQFPTNRNREAVEQVFMKATRIQHLAMGLIYFMSQALHDFSGEEEGARHLIEWANAVGKDTLQTAVNVVPNL